MTLEQFKKRLWDAYEGVIYNTEESLEASRYAKAASLRAEENKFGITACIIRKKLAEQVKYLRLIRLGELRKNVELVMQAYSKDTTITVSKIYDLLTNFVGKDNFGVHLVNGQWYYVLYYHEKTITDSNGKEHIIRDIFIRTPLRSINVKKSAMLRTTVLRKEHANKYYHSHLTNTTVGNWSSGFCWGSSVRHIESNTYIQKLERALIYIDTMLQEESTTTKPHKYISGLTVKRVKRNAWDSLKDYNKIKKPASFNILPKFKHNGSMELHIQDDSRLDKYLLDNYQSSRVYRMGDNYYVYQENEKISVDNKGVEQLEGTVKLLDREISLYIIPDPLEKFEPKIEVCKIFKNKFLSNAEQEINKLYSKWKQYEDALAQYKPTFDFKNNSSFRAYGELYVQSGIYNRMVWDNFLQFSGKFSRTGDRCIDLIGYVSSGETASGGIRAGGDNNGSADSNDGVRNREPEIVRT